ncbi:MAG: hypothetical protein WHT45_11485 [Ignavibacterium sp.]
MKNLLIVVFVFCVLSQLSAQNNSFSQPDTKDFYVDLVAKTAILNGNWGLFGGMRVGIDINKNFSLGLVGHGMIPNKLGGSYINQKGRDTLHFGYGGAEAAYNYYLSKNFYVTSMMMIGAGRVDYANLPGNDYFFIIEPGISFNYMITNWFGVGASADYRFAAGVKYADFSNSSFSGWSTDLSFKFKF